MYDLGVALVKDVRNVSLSQASSNVNEHAEKSKNNNFSALRKLVDNAHSVWTNTS